MSYKTKDGKTHQSVVVFGENGLPVDTIATISGSYVFVEGVDTLTYGGGTVTLSGLYDLEPIVNAKARYTGKYILLTKDGTIYYIDRQTIDTGNNTFVISLSDKIQSNPASIDTSAGWTIAEADIVNRVATTSAAKIDTVEFRDMHFQMELDGDPVTLLNQDGQGINPATEETQLANNSELIDINAELDQQTTELQQANVTLNNIDTELEVIRDNQTNGTQVVKVQDTAGDELEIYPDGSTGTTNASLQVIVETIDEVTYKGESIVGATTTDPVWRISKTTHQPDGDYTTQFAGTGAFDKVWDDRATYFPTPLPVFPFFQKEYDRLFNLLNRSNWMKLGNYDSVSPVYTSSNISELHFSEGGVLIGKAIFFYNNHLDWTITLERYINNTNGDTLLDDDDSPLFLD